MGLDLEKTKSDGESSQIVDNEMTNESVWSKEKEPQVLHKSIPAFSLIIGSRSNSIYS
jgi:hypothetical protein